MFFIQITGNFSPIDLLRDEIWVILTTRTGADIARKVKFNSLCITSCENMLHTWAFWIGKCQVILNFVIVKKGVFAPLDPVDIDPFTPPTSVKPLSDSLVHTSPGNCIPVFNSSTSVKHIFTASNSKWMEGHFSGYMHSTYFGQESIKSCSQQVKSWRSSSDWKIFFTHLITLSDVEELHFLQFLLHIRDKHHQSVTF